MIIILGVCAGLFCYSLWQIGVGLSRMDNDIDKLKKQVKKLRKGSNK